MAIKVTTVCMFSILVVTSIKLIVTGSLLFGSSAASGGHGEQRTPHLEIHVLDTLQCTDHTCRQYRPLLVVDCGHDQVGQRVATKTLTAKALELHGSSFGYSEFVYMRYVACTQCQPRRVNRLLTPTSTQYFHISSDPHSRQPRCALQAQACGCCDCLGAYSVPNTTQFSQVAKILVQHQFASKLQHCKVPQPGYATILHRYSSSICTRQVAPPSATLPPSTSTECGAARRRRR